MPVYGALLERFHAAVIRGHEPAAKNAHQQAEHLAIRMNGGRFGYLRPTTRPATRSCVARTHRKTSRRSGGQEGDFIVAVPNVRVRAKFAGMPRRTGSGLTGRLVA